MPFDDDTFDAAISCYGLHEIPTVQRAVTFTELARVIRPGGKAIAADWDTPQRGRRSVEFVIRIAEKPYALDVVGDGLADALTAVGFTVTRHHRAASRILSFQVIEARLL
jgi:ubiquinone/menaquinone biosynthesis C-methylase UbiE